MSHKQLWGLLSALALLISPLAHSQSSGYFDGTLQSLGTNCLVVGGSVTVIGAQSYVGFRAPASTGDIKYVHAVVANVSGCLNDVAGIELALPLGASFAISSANPVVCTRGVLGGTPQAVPNVMGQSSCSTTGQPGQAGGTFFGHSALPPGWYLEVQVPIKYEHALNGIGGPSSHQLVGVISSSFGFGTNRMFPSQPVTVAYRPQFQNLSNLGVTPTTANVGFDLYSYFVGGTLNVDFGIGNFATSTPNTPVPNTAAGFLGNTANLSMLNPGTTYQWRTRFTPANGTAPLVSPTLSFTTPGQGMSTGEPHLATVNGVSYDFQAAGEFVLLQDKSFEMQSRQTPVGTAQPVPDPTTGLLTCLSVNTAVALRAGSQRITYQSQRKSKSGVPELRLRIDGQAADVAGGAIALADGGMVTGTFAPGGLRIDSGDGSIVLVTPFWWQQAQEWVFNLEAYNVRAHQGLLGTVLPSQWLPALPGGKSLGSRPKDPHERYVTLYEKFGPAWRVSDTSSLFDYEEGTSAGTFVNYEWPMESPASCAVPSQGKLPTLIPASLETARKACAVVASEQQRANCEHDVRLTGDLGFAKHYQLTEQVAKELRDTPTTKR